MTKEMYSVKDIMDIFGFSRAKSYEFIHSTGFPKIKIGRQYYIPIEEYEKWKKSSIGRRITL